MITSSSLSTYSSTYGVGIYSLLITTPEGHLLLYKQVHQPETIPFQWKTSLSSLHVHLLHNRWIGLDSEMDVAIGGGTFHPIQQTKEEPVQVIPSQEKDLSQDLLAFISWDEGLTENPKEPKEPKESKKSKEKRLKESKRTKSSDTATSKRIEGIQVDSFLNSVFG